MALKISPVTLFILTLAIFVTASPAVRKRDLEKEEMKSIRYCQVQTPCAWKIYIPQPELNLKNTYCVCRKGEKCQMHENRRKEGYIEYRCKLNFEYDNGRDK